MEMKRNKKICVPYLFLGKIRVNISHSIKRQIQPLKIACEYEADKKTVFCETKR